MNQKTLPIISHLKDQAHYYQAVRDFFRARDVLEVQTPLLYPAPVTDPYIEAFELQYFKQKLYLQTSPEYAMKRLLAAGSGPIYQICKAFRYEDSGNFHNPEFTLLEWYRPGFEEQDLIQEVDDLLQTLIQTQPLEIKSYRECFEHTLGVNPHQVSRDDLIQLCETHDLHIISSTQLSRDDYLTLLFSHCIERNLGLDRPIVINHFPATQAALAKHKYINHDLVAGRFELYYQGIELANAYDEETNSEKLRAQFEEDLEIRKNLNLKSVPIDEELLAITDILPAGCGIALGLDRLILLGLKLKSLKEFLPFTL